jgi:hypothetical protein
MMNQRERDALDRHITGNYGADQFRDEDDYECIFCGEEVDPLAEHRCQEMRDEAAIRRGEERDEARFFGD